MAVDNSERRFISAGFVQDALRSLDPHDIDTATVLVRAGLPADLPGPVNEAEYGRFWREISVAQKDEFMGLAKRPILPGSFALMCHTPSSTRTFGHALRRSLNFMRGVLEEPSGKLSIKDGEARIEVYAGTGTYSAFAYRTYWLILLGINCCDLPPRNFPQFNVEFAQPLKEQTNTTEPFY